MSLTVASHKYYYLLTSSVRKLLHQHNAKPWRHLSCCLPGWTGKETIAANVSIKMGDYDEMDQRWHDAWSVHIEKHLQGWSCHCGGTFHTCQRRMILPIISSERETRRYHVRKGVSLREKIWANTTGLLPPLCRRNTFNNQLITA